MGKVLICGEVVMPDGNAQSTRLLGFAKMMQQLGKEALLLGTNSSSKISNDGYCDGIAYHNVYASNKLNSLKRRRQRRILLKEYLETIDDLDVILISASYEDSFYKTIRKYAKKKNAKLIASVCEWYALHQYPGLVGKWYIFLHRIATMIVNKRVGNIISISSFFNEYYEKSNCRTILIPTILDLQNYCYVPTIESDRITIVYAGNPGKKDDLTSVIKGISLLNSEEKNKVKFDIYGIDDQFLFNKLHFDKAFIESLKPCIEAHGRIPFEDVSAKIANADFTVLLRPQEKYAKAGYPTKVGESMAAGVPVIANITSDLNRDVIDGVTGIVVENDSAEAFAISLRRILTMNRKDLNTLRINCRNHAEKVFDYRCYIEPMEKFVKELK